MNETQEIIQEIKKLSDIVGCNGRSKSAGEFNSLQEYIIRYNQKPVEVMIGRESNTFYILDKILKALKKEFPDCTTLSENLIMDMNHDNILYPQYMAIEICPQYILELFNVSVINICDEIDMKNMKVKKDSVMVDTFSMMCPLKHDQKILNKIIKCFHQDKIKILKDRISLGMVSIDDGQLCVEEFNIDDKFVAMKEPDLHYGEGFEEFHKQLVKLLTGNSKGLVLLHGNPGTGKTFYIRQLLKELAGKANILYFSPLMVDTITDPSFVQFITTWAQENEDRTNILLIEDAEPLLEDRKKVRNVGITNLLNLTDGLLNDILGIKIIATFNTRLDDLDSALLRPERLIARKEFTILSPDQIRPLVEKIEVAYERIEEYMTQNKVKGMTLAEIYSLKKNTEILQHTIKKKKDGKGIGFNSLTV